MVVKTLKPFKNYFNVLFHLQPRLKLFQNYFNDAEHVGKYS